MMSSHIGLLSAAPAALGPTSCKPFTCPSLPHAVFRRVPTGPFLQLTLTSSQCLWLLTTDNTPGPAVNSGFKNRKGAQEAFSPRPRARSYTMVTMDALLAGEGYIKFTSTCPPFSVSVWIRSIAKNCGN